MTVVLDAHGLTVLAGHRARLQELRRRGEWPAIVPSVGHTGRGGDILPAVTDGASWVGGAGHAATGPGG